MERSIEIVNLVKEKLNEYVEELKKQNEKDLEALKMELRLLVQDHIDNRKFEKLGKDIGVTLNRKILLNAYKRLREEE